MDGMMLLRRARDAGLAVKAQGDKLVIRGPKEAEPVALLLIEHKPAVIAALAPDATWWRRQLAVRTLVWLVAGRTRDEAEALAFEDLAVEWHRRNGEKVEQGRCAGCGDLIGGREALPLGDGNLVHFDSRGFDCLLGFGARWRATAADALVGLGLKPPPSPGRAAGCIATTNLGVAAVRGRRDVA